MPVGHTTLSLFPVSRKYLYYGIPCVSGQAESSERRAAGERGHVEPDRDTGVTL